MHSFAALLAENPLFVFAMPEEAGDEFTPHSPLFTGIGKVNASYHLTRRIALEKPSIIINLGSAGSPVHKRESIICCTEFVQRDMNVTALGFAPYQTPYSTDPAIIQYGLAIDGLPLAICGSGDNFETNHTTDAYHVIDMEAYALALIAMREKIPFLCLKYISDGADGTSSVDWRSTLVRASKSLKSVIDTLKAA